MHKKSILDKLELQDFSDLLFLQKYVFTLVDNTLL